MQFASGNLGIAWEINKIAVGRAVWTETPEPLSLFIMPKAKKPTAATPSDEEEEEYEEYEQEEEEEDDDREIQVRMSVKPKLKQTAPKPAPKKTGDLTKFRHFISTDDNRELFERATRQQAKKEVTAGFRPSKAKEKAPEKVRANCDTVIIPPDITRRKSRGVNLRRPVTWV